MCVLLISLVNNDFQINKGTISLKRFTRKANRFTPHGSKDILNITYLP